MKAATDVAVEAGKALDNLTSITLVFSSHDEWSGNYVLTHGDLHEILNALSDAVASLKRIIAFATATGSGPQLEQ